MKNFTLHLIRHGLTQSNIDGVYAGGSLDIPLCAEGIAGLKELKKAYHYPEVATLFSSPMQRAVETAELLFPGAADRYLLEDLRENRFGIFEGRKMAELMEDDRFVAWLDPESDYLPEGGESGRHFTERTGRALLGMMEHLARNDIREAACVTHGGVIMAMLSNHGLPRRRYNEWMSDNGCGFTVRADAAMLMRDQMVEVCGIVPYGYGS